MALQNLDPEIGYEGVRATHGAVAESAKITLNLTHLAPLLNFAFLYY
jgi:hypothetical protein